MMCTKLFRQLLLLNTQATYIGLLFRLNFVVQRFKKVGSPSLDLWGPVHRLAFSVGGRYNRYTIRHQLGCDMPI